MYFNSIEYLNIDSTPTDEACAQLGSCSQDVLRLEARIFSNQLERTFGPYPEAFYIQISSNQHDFGSYYDLKLCYEDDSEDSEALAKALEIEEAIPAKWDEQSIQELTEKDYFMSISKKEETRSDQQQLRVS